MIKKIIYLFLFLSFAVHGQQTINKLITKELTVQDKVEVTSTTKSSKPCPVMTEVQRDAISSPATGSCVYNSTSLQLNVYDGVDWQEAGGGGISLWQTALVYEGNDVVIESDKIYRCIIAHTSGTFATDLSNGNWTEVSSTDLASASGVLSIANGGTGSTTQNFVDLTTNQTVAGEKTFSNTLKSDSIQTTGSSGVVIKNSSGAQVADFGPANTTNVSITGGLSVGVNLQATGTVTGSNLSGTNTGDGEAETQAGYLAATQKIIQTPNNQLTTIDVATKKYKIETGNNNELINLGFESPTIGEGWTISNATSSSSTTRIEGAKSLSLALTGALSLSQSSTINAAQKSGVQMVASIWVNSSDVSDLQLCSLKNGSEDKCTVVGGYVQGTGWKQLTVSFLGDSTSNGLKLKSTDTTGTVLVDQAFVGLGSPIVDFTPDMVYSAKISATGGILSQNTDFIASCTNANPIVCAFKPNEFTVAPVCSAVIDYGGAGAVTVRASSISSSSVSFERFDLNATISNGGVMVVCQKQGADYKTSKAYVASSSDFGYTNAGAITITATTTNPTKGTISIDRVRYSRKGQNIIARYQFRQTAAGSAGSGEYLFALPSGLSFDTNTITPYSGALYSGTSALAGSLVGYGQHGSVTENSICKAFAYDSTRFRVMCYQNMSASTGASVAAYFVGAASAGPLNVAAMAYDWFIDAPIQGWTDSGVIVGSFQGYNETPGTSRVETFSVSYAGANAGTATATNCTTSPCNIDQIGNNVSTITRTSAGVYNLNLSKTMSSLKCSGNATSVGSSQVTMSEISCKSCPTVQFAMGTALDTEGTILCQGIPQ